MREEVRRAIAHAAVARINGRSNSAVYSFEEGTHSFVGGDARNFYDFESQAHVTGSGDTLFHHGTGAHINLSISGSNFSGYDFESGQHFRGSVNGSRVQIYDFGEGQHFHYQA